MSWDGKSSACLRSDGGKEYFSGQFNGYLQQMGSRRIMKLSGSSHSSLSLRLLFLACNSLASKSEESPFEASKESKLLFQERD
jgi:hypothetical protein